MEVPGQVPSLPPLNPALYLMGNKSVGEVPIVVKKVITSAVMTQRSRNKPQRKKTDLITIANLLERRVVVVRFFAEVARSRCYAFRRAY